MFVLDRTICENKRKNDKKQQHKNKYKNVQ